MFQRVFIVVASAGSSSPFAFSESSDGPMAFRSAASAFLSSFAILGDELLSLRSVTQRARRNLNKINQQNRNRNSLSPPASITRKSKPRPSLRGASRSMRSPTWQ